MTNLRTSMLCLALLSPAAGAVTFDCAKAGTPVEKMICADAALSRLDDNLGVAYQRAMERVGDKPMMLDRQRNWLAERNACKNIACVKELYQMRLRGLNEMVASPWTGLYVRHTQGKVDPNTAKIWIHANSDGNISVNGKAVLKNPAGAKGKERQARVGSWGHVQEGSDTITFGLEMCEVSARRAGAVLQVEDSGHCGDPKATFTGEYRRE